MKYVAPQIITFSEQELNDYITVAAGSAEAQCSNSGVWDPRVCADVNAKPYGGGSHNSIGDILL